MPEATRYQRSWVFSGAAEPAPKGSATRRWATPPRGTRKAVPQAERRPAENLTQLQAANALVSGLCAWGMGAVLVRHAQIHAQRKGNSLCGVQSAGKGRKEETNSQDHLEQAVPG